MCVRFIFGAYDIIKRKKFEKKKIKNGNYFFFSSIKTCPKTLIYQQLFARLVL